MAKDLDIVPECYIDTNLVETLLALRRCKTDGVNHQKGCNTVVNVMKKNFGDCFALGVVDADKRRLSYLDDCQELASSEHIALMKHQKAQHFFLLIKPAMDTLILKAAEEAGVNLSDYDLPFELGKFKDVTKRVDSKKDSRFKRLFKDIQSTKEMLILANILTYLRAHKYDFEEEVLKKFFS